MSPGGKGANQAFAALRSGAKTALISRVGDDGMGHMIVTQLRREGVITSGVMESKDAPTGCAFILRAPGGHNRIIVASGANAEITHDQIPDEILKSDTVILAQMEAPPDQTHELLRRAKAKGAQTILNLAPAATLPANMLSCVDYLIVNEIEARQLAGHLHLTGDILDICADVSKQYHLTCIATLGEKGALAWVKGGKPILTPAYPIEHVVDTTGAGDAWCGTFACALHDRKPLAEALKRACIAGSLSCMKKGTQSSYPYLAEIEEAMTAHGHKT
jgi:ribokinase